MSTIFAALNVDKPPGMTSHDVVARLRRIYGLKRIGHLGTLDPLATGVLPVCLGSATRLIEYFPDDKRYRARVTLGLTTATLDSEGDILTRTDCTGLDLSAPRLEALLEPFRGEINQQVPLYSAVHVGGRKLYELARAGKMAELPTRPVTIHALALADVDLAEPAHPVLVLDVHCSSGTYIRSLARDIGNALGCGAFLSALTRTAHGAFTLDASVSLEQLGGTDYPGQYLLNPVSYLALPELIIGTEDEPDAVCQLLSGIKIAVPPGSKLKPNRFCMVTSGGKPVCIAQRIQNQLKPVKVFSDAFAAG